MANVSQEQNALREMIAAFRVSELQLLLGKIFLLYYILSVTWILGRNIYSLKEIHQRSFLALELKVKKHMKLKLVLCFFREIIVLRL